MKVLIISHRLPYPPCSGATIRNYNLIKECSKNNEIHLITFGQETQFESHDQFKTANALLKQFCKEVVIIEPPIEKKRIRWVLLLLFNLFSRLPYSIKRFWSRKMVSAIIENLSRNKIDLVEIGTIGMLKYAEIAPEIPKLLIHHNVESLLFESRGRSESNPFKKLYLALQAYKMRRLERNTSGLIDYHTVVSPLDRSRLLKINPRADITVIENGVNLEYYQPSERKEEVAHLLTFTGEMSWFPNDRAMRYFFSYIWPIISRDLPEIAIDIVGASPSKWLVDLGKRNKQIRVYGFVEDVRPYVRKASLYIVPLTVGGGTRLKILEAMSMGKAIVSTTIGSEGLNVSDGHDILIADGYKEFAQKAILALRDEQLRNRLGLNARQTVERQYSWKQIAGKLDNLYKKASAKEKN